VRRRRDSHRRSLGQDLWDEAEESWASRVQSTRNGAADMRVCDFVWLPV
jgi:hypothetical protein